ncbi:glycoside hydrolase family 16 protein [Daldinia bambusicola]|nr:glycoside hydrolase family 16 protein [Daldinia bambusicola]
MFSKLLSTTAVVLAATQLVSAQTHTDCDPTKKKCPADPALGTTVTVDFTKGENSLFKAADGTTLSYDKNGAVFTINKETEAPTITSTKYVFFGKIDVELQAAPGTGVVTSFVLQSDDLDEIDWEWLGGDKTQVQSNYFGKGDTTTYDRGAYHDVSNPQDQVYKYTIDWTKDYVRWLINDQQVRELKYADAKGGSRFPQTPMQIKLGTWVAGRSDAPQGTVEWAGGKTDFSQAPFIAHYKSVTIQDYSNGVKNAKNYVWADGSDGSYQSIKVETGDGKNDDTTSSSSASSTAKSTKTTETKSASETASTKTSDKTTLTTVTSSASATATASASASASESATPTGGNDTSAAPSGSSSTSPAAPTTSIPTTNAGMKTGFSAAAIGACLMAVFML